MCFGRCMHTPEEQATDQQHAAPSVEVPAHSGPLLSEAMSDVERDSNMALPAEFAMLLATHHSLDTASGGPSAASLALGSAAQQSRALHDKLLPPRQGTALAPVPELEREPSCSAGDASNMASIIQGLASISAQGPTKVTSSLAHLAAQLPVSYAALTAFSSCGKHYQQSGAAFVYNHDTYGVSQPTRMPRHAASEIPGPAKPVQQEDLPTFGRMAEVSSACRGWVVPGCLTLQTLLATTPMHSQVTATACHLLCSMR